MVLAVVMVEPDDLVSSRGQARPRPCPPQDILCKRSSGNQCLQKLLSLILDVNFLSINVAFITLLLYSNVMARNKDGDFIFVDLLRENSGAHKMRVFVFHQHAYIHVF